MGYIALAVFWILAVAAVVISAAWPDPFVRHGAGLAAAQGYPVKGVFWTVAIICAEGAVIAWILRPATYRRSWARALAALGVAGLFVLLGALSSQYTPPYYLVYLWWAVLVTVMLAGLCAWSGIARLRARMSR